MGKKAWDKRSWAGIMRMAWLDIHKIGGMYVSKKDKKTGHTLLLAPWIDEPKREQSEFVVIQSRKWRFVVLQSEGGGRREEWHGCTHCRNMFNHIGLTSFL